MSQAPAPAPWENRIIGSGSVSPAELQANPRNWRTHPANQQEALASVLSRVGWVQQVVVNKRSGFVVDGHLRVALAMQREEPEIPVVYVDLDDEEEGIILATFDPIGAMASRDDAVLMELLSGIGEQDALLQSLLDDMRALPAPAAAPPLGPTLLDRFLVPPFSVLDARQGYWQERKRQWIALGIRSEIGRGENLLGLTPAEERTMGPGGLKAYRERLSPGGSPLPAAKLNAEGKTDRGDGRGRRLTWAAGAERHDETSAKILAGGRKDDPEAGASGTSIFDPVLCELAYRWFAPENGIVLDPFAGGSVRGIVAAMLGREYHGIDLAAGQIAANREQWAEIGPASSSPTVPVKVSAKMARLRFHGCEPGYIADVCHASCCESSVSPTGTLITINPEEEPAIRARGGEVIDGLLQPREGEKRCPFKTEAHLCGLHGEADKPFGCIASPFTLNDHGTLIIRNRYKTLKCYRDDRDGEPPPAYVAFRSSLDLIFGEAEAARICEHLDAGGGDIVAHMPRRSLEMLRENDAIKRAPAPAADKSGPPSPTWYVGDSRALSAILPEGLLADLVFTCPPYGDLERYSDDPADISTMSYPAFMESFGHIIKAASERLRENRFMVLVVGDFRGPDGAYRGFVADTIAAAGNAGLRLYNDAILVTAVGSLSIRAGRYFSGSRKLGKTHQNVLVFVKGDARRAHEELGPVAVPEEIIAEMVVDEGE